MLGAISRLTKLHTLCYNTDSSKVERGYGNSLSKNIKVDEIKICPNLKYLNVQSIETLSLFNARSGHILER